MRRTMPYFFCLLLVATATAMAYEEPQFEVLGTTSDYEVRRYAPYIVAEVEVAGTPRQAGNDAFRILAGYIFGDNDGAEKMEMTTPVESRDAGRGTRMNMTVPVMSVAADTGGSRYTYAFVMERRYTMKTLPKPTDARIRLIERPSRVMAVRRYSGGWGEKRYRRHEAELQAALRADGVDLLGASVFARYNGPFTPWFLRRNEIMIEVDWPGPGEPVDDTREEASR